MTVWLRDAVEVGNDRIVFVAKSAARMILADVPHRTFVPIALGQYGAGGAEGDTGSVESLRGGKRFGVVTAGRAPDQGHPNP